MMFNGLRHSLLLEPLWVRRLEGFDQKKMPSDPSDRMAARLFVSCLNSPWKPEKTNDFTVCRFGSPTFLITPSPPYIPPLNPSEKSMRPVRERPGQTKFRKDLKSVYDNRCCISGCRVPQVLQAAHIDPYYSDASDNVRNGLLLRSDLHLLFDNYMIGVEPVSLLVQLTKSLRSDPHYSNFHGRKLTIASDSSHHPDHGALLRHWRRFQKENKE